MEERNLSIAKGNQTVSHVSAAESWVACVVEYEEGWLVGAVYLNGRMASDFLKVLKSSNKTLPPEAQPTDLSFTPDAVVLAVALDTVGIRLFSMVAPIGETNARVLEASTIEVPGYNISRVVWINMFSEAHPMVTFGHCVSTAIGSIMVRGGFGAATRNATTVATENNPGQIRLFDACFPGHIAFVSAAGDGAPNSLTLLIRTNLVFDRSCIPIGYETEKRPTAVAVGDKLAVVGYSYPPGYNGVGLVEVFRIGETSVHATRSILQSVPTSLCTNGERVLIGASSAVPWGHDSSVSTVYCFSSKQEESFAVAKGGEEHPTWHPRSLWMGPTGWCFGRTIVNDSGERFSEINCARVASR